MSLNDKGEKVFYGQDPNGRTDHHGIVTKKVIIVTRVGQYGNSSNRLRL